MISHLNLQQLEEALASAKHQLETYQNNLATAPPDQKPYWQNHLETHSKYIIEIEEMARARKDAYYDITIRNLYKSEWTQITYGGGTKVNTYDGDVIGVEIEYEGENLQCNPAVYWKCNSEHSLRPYKNHPPVEYALIKPLDRAELAKALDYLEKKLQQNKANPVVSPRTSLHVHLNAQTWTWKQIVTWFILYALVEDILVEFSGKERIGNLFCLRSRDTHYFLNCLESAIKNEHYGLVTNSEYRYTSMNLASITKFGSVEFRSMRSPIPFADMGKWVDILCAIKKSSLFFKTPNAVIEYFETYGPKQMLKRIFPEPWMNQLFTHPNLQEIMWSAVREVKDVAYACDWKAKQTKPKEEEIVASQIIDDPLNQMVEEYNLGEDDFA